MNAPEPASNKQLPRPIWGILLVVAVWGLYLGLGTLIYRPEQTDDLSLIRGIRRFLLVLSCFALFLTFWLTLLRYRSRRN